MITAILALIKKIPWQLWLLSGVIFSFWWYGQWQFGRGQKLIQKEWEASIERGRKIVADLTEKSNKINTVVETKYVDQVKVIREKGKTVVKEIPVYIPASTPDLPGGFRLLHDAAATSTLPYRSRISDAKSVRVEDATTIIVENYTECHQWREQVLGWQGWYQEQSLAWQTAQRKSQ